MSRLMVRILFAALLITAFVIPQADAQTSAAPASPNIVPAKIAWINLDQVILTCDEGTKTFKNIQDFINGKNDEMDILKKELDDLKTKLSAGGSKITDDYREELENKIEMKEVVLQRFQQDTQKEINSMRDRATNAIAKKLLPVIEKIAKEKGLNAIQILSSSRDAWIDPALVISEDVIKAYNKENPPSTLKSPATPAKKEK
jgi:outer membrane protein